MIELKIWVFCILLVLAILGFLAVCRLVWFEVIERLIDIVWNYKKYKKFYNEHRDDSFEKFLKAKEQFLELDKDKIEEVQAMIKETLNNAQKEE